MCEMTEREGRMRKEKGKGNFFRFNMIGMLGEVAYTTKLYTEENGRFI